MSFDRTHQQQDLGRPLGATIVLLAALIVVELAGPGWDDLDWSQVDAPIQAHFAIHDEWATVDGAEAIKSSVHVPMDLHIYDAQHAFCNERRPDVYNPEAAKQAWAYAIGFLRSHTA